MIDNSFFLGENVICLNYVVQIQYYYPIFDKPNDELFKRDKFFKGMTDNPMILAVKWVGRRPNFFRSFGLWKLNDFEEIIKHS